MTNDFNVNDFDHFDPDDVKPEADAAEQQRPALREDLDQDERVAR